MISKIEIEGYKNISSFVVQPDRLNILVGANSSGKSSVLQALQFAVAVAQATSKDKNSPVFQDRGRSFIPIDNMLYVPGINEYVFNLHSGLTYKDEDITNRTVVVRFDLDTGQSISEEINSPNDTSGLSVTFTPPTAIDILGSIQNPFSIYTPGLAGIARQETLVSMGMLRRSIARGDSNMVLRNVIYRLFTDKIDSRAAFEDALSKVFPTHRLEVQFDQDTDEYILVTLHRDGSDGIPLDNAGTGLLQVIQILSYLFLFEPQLVLLDEPDAHLHPSNQRRLMRLLARLAIERNFQVFIATHSRHILDELYDQASVIWMRDGAVQESNAYQEVLIELGALDSVERLYSGTIKYIVLTEDKKTAYLDAILSSILQRDFFQVWSYRGCTNLLTAEVLAEFIQNISPTTQIVIHRDRDYFDQAYLEARVTRFRDRNFHVFFTRGVDIESHFIHLPHLEALNARPGSRLKVDLPEVYRQALVACESRLREKAKRSAQNALIYSRSEDLPWKNDEECRLWSENIDFVRDPHYIHGKIMLGALRDAYQKLNGGTLLVDLPSPHLLHDELRAILGVVATGD